MIYLMIATFFLLEMGNGFYFGTWRRVLHATLFIYPFLVHEITPFHHADSLKYANSDLGICQDARQLY